MYWISKMKQVHLWTHLRYHKDFKTIVGKVNNFLYDNVLEYLPYSSCHQSPEGEILPFIYKYQCQQPILGSRIFLYPIGGHQLLLTELEVFTVEPEPDLSFVWLEWSEWSKCSVPCDGATSLAMRQKERLCESTHLQYGTANVRPTRTVDSLHCKDTYPGEESTMAENCGHGICVESNEQAFHCNIYFFLQFKDSIMHMCFPIAAPASGYTTSSTWNKALDQDFGTYRMFTQPGTYLWVIKNLKGNAMED